MKIKWMIITGSFLISGCENPGFVTGKVVDAETSLPLDSVRCLVTTGKDIDYTDNTGAFDVTNRTSPCALWGKKEITVEYSKQGYTTQSSDSRGSNVTILLQKQ